MSSLFMAVVRELYLDLERPVDLSGAIIEEFELEDVEDEEFKLQRNTAFVFSQSLNYASSLIRYASDTAVLMVVTSGLICVIVYFENEYRGCPFSKNTHGSYVAKYFSSKIILKELSTIKNAVSESEFNDENIEIRVNELTREITVRYLVDEGQKSEMSIRFPPSYPLMEVEIVGTSRVGVSQERWNKWLLTCKIACKVYPLHAKIKTKKEWINC